MGLDEAKHHLLSLSHLNYVKGPEVDRDRPEFNIWEFGKTIEGRDVYIKLSDDLGIYGAKCISFHFADFPIRYPFRIAS